MVAKLRHQSIRVRPIRSNTIRILAIVHILGHRCDDAPVFAPNECARPAPIWDRGVLLFVSSPTLALRLLFKYDVRSGYNRAGNTRRLKR